MRRSMLLAVPLGVAVLSSCSGGGGGGGGGGEPTQPVDSVRIRTATLRGVFAAQGGTASVLVDGQPATLSGSNWQREVEVPPGGGQVVVQLRVDGWLVAERTLDIPQPE